MKIRIDPLDKLFSEFIRRRAMVRVGGCERCLTPKVSYKQLQCSHFHGRSRKSVRWDEDNAVGLCYGCHQYLSSHPQEHLEWFKKHIGVSEFENLEGRMRQRGHPDKQLLTLYYKAQLEEIER
ncbi:hypothetical protein LCGC14_1389770 [marine sediment metagenome]|uniref:HNH domain-containing protein n=1 Tax=marine sediment metagenome TaxID=412755 RepID=A0A0F9K0H7_9ZZZZ